ncbi:MAG: hypothetical protein AAB225_01525 [Acidobacteriota bacterium]
MKALEFEAKLGTDANLKVPDDLAAQIPKEAPVRVIVLLPESAEEADWRRLTNEQFLRGYSESDSIYDAV